MNETGSAASRRRSSRSRGDGAYSRLKFEGGVHRVQRVPATESSGRIHTSTATVVVLPEADEVEVADRRGAGPADRRQALVRSRRPVRQHDRLRGADHPPADGPRRRDPGREEPAQEQGQGARRSCARGSTTCSCRSSARRTPRRAARWSARAIVPRRSGRTTSRRTGSPTTGCGHDRARPAGRPRGRPGQADRCAAA